MMTAELTGHLRQLTPVLVPDVSQDSRYIQVVEDAYWPTFFTDRVQNVPVGIKQDVFGIIATFSMESWYLDDA
jgi:hypothetical protein